MSLKTTSRLPFSDPTIYGLLIASGLSLGAFVAVESWVVQPVMPLSLLAHRTSGFVALNNLIIAIVSFAVLYNVPLVSGRVLAHSLAGPRGSVRWLRSDANTDRPEFPPPPYFQFFVTVLLRTSANAGSHLIPNSCMIMIGSLGAGAIMRKTGKYYYLELAGACGQSPTWTFSPRSDAAPPSLTPNCLPSQLLGIITSSVIFIFWDYDTPEWVLYLTMIPSVSGTPPPRPRRLGSLTGLVLNPTAHRRVSASPAFSRRRLSPSSRAYLASRSRSRPEVRPKPSPSPPLPPPTTYRPASSLVSVG